MSQAVLLFGMLLLVQPRGAQSQETAKSLAPDRFEVAAIKLNPNCSKERVPPLALSKGKLRIECVTVEQLIRDAYASDYTRTVEVQGGPRWIRSDYFAVHAEAEGASSLVRVLGPLMRALLEDRLRLKIHRAEEPAPIYLLSVAKGGAKVQRAKERKCSNVDLSIPPDSRPTQAQEPLCGMKLRFGSPMSIDVYGMTMNLFAARFSMRMDRNVFDNTGLEGPFDFHLEFSPDSSTPGLFPRRPLTAVDSGPSLPMPEGPSIFTAIEQQLGLILQPARGLVEVLVIDQIDRPSDN